MCFLKRTKTWVARDLSEMLANLSGSWTQRGREDSEFFAQKMVIDLFNEYTLDDIIAEYSKQELSDMYSIFYSVKPLTSFDKAKIVQMIHQYIYKMNRAGVLLG